MLRIAVMSCHGTSGSSRRASGDKCRAASPMISNLRFTASYFSSLAINCCLFTPLTNRAMALAALRMSARYALSLDIDWPGGGQDGVATIRVLTALDGPAAHEVNGSSKNLRQFQLQIRPSQQCAARL